MQKMKAKIAYQLKMMWMEIQNNHHKDVRKSHQRKLLLLENSSNGGGEENGQQIDGKARPEKFKHSIGF